MTAAAVALPKEATYWGFVLKQARGSVLGIRRGKRKIGKIKLKNEIYFCHVTAAAVALPKEATYWGFVLKQARGSVLGIRRGKRKIGKIKLKNEIYFCHVTAAAVALRGYILGTRSTLMKSIIELKEIVTSYLMKIIYFLEFS